MKSPSFESAYRDKDPNPRGGLRGARGVSVFGDRLVISNAERLMIFDLAWNLVSEMTHPLMGGVHDILAEKDGIWVTCASSDLLIRMDWQGNLTSDWEWRLDKTLVTTLGFKSVPKVNRNLDYRDPETMRDGVRNMVHLNAVNRSPNGLLLSFGRILSSRAYKKAKVASALGKVAKTLGLQPRRNHPTPNSMLPVGVIEDSSSAIVLVKDDGTVQICTQANGTRVPNHNIAQINDTLIYNDSNDGRAVIVSLEKKREDRSIKIPGNPSFARGLAIMDDDTIFVGSQAPVSLYQIDLRVGEISAELRLDGEPNESIYGICPLPEEFADPPIQLTPKASERGTTWGSMF